MRFFKQLFSDNNDINEKSVAGFIALLMMVIALGVDIYTGIKGMAMPINEFIFDGFLYTTLGALGIAEVGKIFKTKNTKEEETTDEQH
jgi:hypothetical protein